MLNACLCLGSLTQYLGRVCPLVFAMHTPRRGVCDFLKPRGQEGKYQQTKLVMGWQWGVGGLLCCCRRASSSRVLGVLLLFNMHDFGDQGHILSPLVFILRVTVEVVGPLYLLPGELDASQLPSVIIVPPAAPKSDTHVSLCSDCLSLGVGILGGIP